MLIRQWIAPRSHPLLDGLLQMKESLFSIRSGLKVDRPGIANPVRPIIGLKERRRLRDDKDLILAGKFVVIRRIDLGRLRGTDEQRRMP